MTEIQVEKDLISVIVPIYGVEKYLHQCVDSIINQTYKNLEIILVDDGSEDNCPLICDEYEKKESRVKVIHKENGGQDSARKAGISIAKGEYIGYVDGDDWIEPQMYERLHELIVQNNACIVESAVYDSNGEDHKKRCPVIAPGMYDGEKFANEIAPRLLYSGEFFTHGVFPYLVSKLFKAEAIRPFQMEPDYSDNLFDDTFVTFPAILATESMYVTYDCFYHYRVRMDSAIREQRKDIFARVSEGYPTWIQKFVKSRKDYLDSMKKQLVFFTMYLLVEKAIQVFDDKDTDEYLIPFGGINKKKKIVLYGAGATGIHIKNYCDSVKGSNVVFWADRNYKQFPEQLGIGNPVDIKDLEYDYVVISILFSHSVESARKGLIELGVPKEKIVWIKDEYLDNPERLLNSCFINANNTLTSIG